jgi:outer membrane protein assembly factor BamB
MREGSRWRWVVAALLVGALVLGLGFLLRAAGLTAAANVAQLVSLAPLVAAVIGWAKARYVGRGPDGHRMVSLSEILRTIADAQGLTGADLRARMPRWNNDLDAYLDGSRRPGWDFVNAFLDLIAGNDRWRREVLERRIRALWEAADIPQSNRSPDKVIVSNAAAVPGTTSWLRALREVADTRRVTIRVETSVDRYESLQEGLTRVLHRLTQAITSLGTERDELRDALAVLASQSQHYGSAPTGTELDDLRRQLRDTQQQLTHAEQLRVDTEQRLDESEKQRRHAEQLRDKAEDQARLAWRRLAEVERRQVFGQLQTHAISQTSSIDLAETWNTDMAAGRRVLDQVDQILRDETVTLNRIGDDLAAAASIQGKEGAREAGSGWHSNINLRNITIAAVCVAICLSVCADDTILAWPRYLSPHTLWTDEIGYLASGPSVYNGTVYCSSTTGIYALSAANGHVLWTFPTGGGLSIPAVTSDTVYTLGDDGRLRALSAANGHVLWSDNIGGESNPTVSNGTVYIVGSGRMYALRASDGQIRWTGAMGKVDGSYTPAVADDTIFIGSDDHKVYAFNASNGHVRWTFTTGDLVESSPAVIGGTVYIGSFDGAVYALNVFNGHLRWLYLTAPTSDGQPAGIASGLRVMEGMLYFGSVGPEDPWGAVYALNAITGRVRWAYIDKGLNYGTPVEANGIVYNSGITTVYALSATVP